MKNYTKGDFPTDENFVPVDKYYFYNNGVPHRDNELLCENLAKKLNELEIYSFYGKDGDWLTKHVKPVYEASGAIWYTE